MIPSDLYQTYAEENMLGSSPIRLVTALYEGAIEAVREAKRCFDAGDIWGRSRSITKAVNVLTELLVSLDHEKGGEVSQNLKRLYSYMQRRLLDANTKKDPTPLREAEELLSSLLEAWYVVAEQTTTGALVVSNQHLIAMTEDPISDAVPLLYGSYFGEAGESSLSEVFSF